MSGWALNGPVPTEVADGRRMLYTATGGAEGVGSGTDLVVKPLAVPGQGVRVLPGTAVMRSRYNSAGNESYQGAITSERTLATTPTGSTPAGGRSDLVVMQVEDPYAENSPWTAPANPATYDGFPIRIIEGVPAGTTRLQDVPGYQNRTAVTLARIDIPASTGTITAEMVKDVRKVARPRRESVMRTYALIASDEQRVTSRTAYPSGGQTWPLAAELAWGPIPIPEWATRMKIVMTWAGVSSYNNPWGEAWVQVGPTVNPDNVKTQLVSWDMQNAPGWARTVVIAADEIAVPAALRGTAQVFYPRANLHPNVPGGSYAKLDWGSAMVLQVEFFEAAYQ